MFVKKKVQWSGRRMEAPSLVSLAGLVVLLACAESGRANDRSETPSGNVNTARVLAQEPSGTEWLVNGRDFGSTHFSPIAYGGTAQRHLL